MTNPQRVLEIYNQNAQLWLNQGVQGVGFIAKKIVNHLQDDGIRYKASTVNGDLTYARHFCPDKLVIPVERFIAPKKPKRPKTYKPRRTPTYFRVAELLLQGFSRRDVGRQLGMRDQTVNSHMYNAIKQSVLRRTVERTERYSHY